MKRIQVRIVPFFLLTAILLSGIVLRAETTENSPGKTILCILSYSADYQWSNDILGGLRHSVQSGNLPGAFEVFELGVNMQPDSRPRAADIERLQSYLKRYRYDAVVLLGNPAVELFLSGQLKAAPDVPVVFSAYFTPPRMRGKSFPAAMAGLTMPPTNRANIELGAKLFPGLREIVILTNAADDGTAIKEELERVRPEIGFDGKLTILDGTSVSTEAMLARLEALPAASMVIYNDWFSSGDGLKYSRNTILDELSKSAQHLPILINTDNIPADQGFAFGGSMVSGKKLGHDTGELLMRVLRGEAPAAIPVRTVTPEYRFDHRQLGRFRITPGLLPADSTILREPPGLLEKYAPAMMTASILLIGILLGGLFWLLLRSRYNRRMYAIFDASPARIMVVDAFGEVLFSRTGDQDPGRKELLALDRIRPEAYPELWNGIQEVSKNGRPLSFHYHGVCGFLRRADLRRLPADIFGRETVLIVSLDVEEMRKLQEEYRKTAEQMRLTLESIGDGVIVTDAEERVILLNRVAGELTGVPPREAAGQHLDQVFHIISYTDDSPVPSPLHKALETRQIVMLANHTDLIARNGRRLHIADSAAPVISRDGTLTGAVLVFRDVTEEYDRRDRLHVQKAVLEKALAAGEMTFFRCDGNREFLQTADPAFWPCRDGRPLPHAEWVHPDDVEALEQGSAELFSGARREFRFLYRVKRKEMVRSYEILMYDDVSPVSERKEFFGIIRDVTSFREREINYRNALALLHDIIDNIPGYIWVKEVENNLRHLLANRRIGDLTGVPESELLGHTDMEILPPEVETLFRRADETTLRDGRCESTLSIRGASGTMHELKVVQTILTRPDGTRLLLGVGVDISRELGMEKQLQEKNRLLEDILANLPLPLFIKDFHNGNRYLFASRTFLDMLGTEKSALLEHTDFDAMPREAAEKFTADDSAAMRSDIPLTAVEEIRLPDGRVARYQTRKVRLCRDSGNDLLLGVGVDITELTESRNELTRSNELLRAITDNLPCALFVKDADREFRYIMHNRVFTEAFGLTERQVIGFSDPELLLPENARLCGASDRAALEAGGVSDIQEVVTLADGKLHTLRCIKGIVKRKDGSRLLLGISMDITLEQQMLEELRVYGAQQRALNAALETILLSENFPAAIREVLRLIGEQAKADRCYIFSRDYEKQTTNNDFEWTAEGIAPETCYLQNLPLQLSPGWEEALLSRRIIFSTDVKNETQCAAVMEAREVLLPQQIKSILVTGIWLDGILWGFIGFDFVRKPIAYPEIAEKMLSATAHLIEIALVRKKRQQELERSEYEKKLVMDTIKTPIILYDGEMNLLRANNAANRIALLDPEKAAADHVPCNLVFCGEAACPQHCPVRLALDDHREHSCEMGIRGRDYLITASPILFDGRLSYILKTMLDITEFNSVQDRLRRAVLDAESASKAKSCFLATMSHELRTPLNAVIGFSELLRNDTLPRNEQNDYLQSINFAGNALLKLINDILDLSKIEAGQSVITPERSDFAALCREIHSIFKLQAEEKKLEFVLECDPDLPCLYLDTLRLRQVLLNLTGNAMKFTWSGSIRLAVRFRPENGETGTLSIQVADTGIGISEESRETIFEPFVQDRKRRDEHAYQGTGLGLSISSRLISQMGGRITLESEPGKGSCFTVVLEHVKFEAVRTPAADAGAGTEQPGTAPSPARQFSLLLVDDVAMNLKVLSAMLRKLGVETRCASSGAEALELLKARRPDMLLTDMWMPGMNGPELAAAVRKLPEGGRLRIVAVTADTEVRTNFGAEEFDDIMLKPLTLEKLRKLLDDFNRKPEE